MTCRSKPSDRNSAMTSARLESMKSAGLVREAETFVDSRRNEVRNIYWRDILDVLHCIVADYMKYMLIFIWNGVTQIPVP